jgi:hypothetical protein
MPQLACPQQQSTTSLFGSNSRKRLSSLEDTSGHTPTKHLQRRYTNIQGPLHCNHGRRLRQFPNPPVAWIGTANCAYLEPRTTVARSTQRLSIHIQPRALQLQSYATRSHGLCGTIPYQTKQT